MLLPKPHTPGYGYLFRTRGFTPCHYSLLAEDESHHSKLMINLQEHKIPTAIYYPVPLHRQMAFAILGYPQGSLPVSEDAAKRIFSIPMHPYLNSDDQKKIVSTMEDGLQS